jgi:transglutaminase-like putative cysteine protease
MPVEMDDQPIEASFFSQGEWLTSFITPNALEVEVLHERLTQGLTTLEERIAALHHYVAADIKYKSFIEGKLWIEGQISKQKDLWMKPSLTKLIGVGNCANKSFLLASLLRREMDTDNIHCVLGNLYNGKPGGHAWVQVKVGGQEYIVESTQPEAPAMVSTRNTERYEAIHYFNDQETYAEPDKTVLEPFTRCFSTWLRDYLDWTYIEGGGRK